MPVDLREHLEPGLRYVDRAAAGAAVVVRVVLASTFRPAPRQTAAAVLATDKGGAVDKTYTGPVPGHEVPLSEAET